MKLNPNNLQFFLDSAEEAGGKGYCSLSFKCEGKMTLLEFIKYLHKFHPQSLE